MQIQTNLTDGAKIHDSIRYPSIEHQVYGLFAMFGHHDSSCDLDYDIHTNYFLTMYGNKCLVEVGKNGVKISVLTPHESNVRFGEAAYPSVKLPYNTDIGVKVLWLYNFLKKLKALTEKAQPLAEQYKQLSTEKIAQSLKQQLETDRVTVSYWRDNLFSGREITFAIHPKGKAPADGLMVCLNKENKIESFWDGSTQRRSLCYEGRQDLERAVGKYGTNLESLKKKVEALEQLEKKVAHFDLTHSPELAQLLQLKQQADQLVKEYESITRPG